MRGFERGFASRHSLCATLALAIAILASGAASAAVTTSPSSATVVTGQTSLTITLTLTFTPNSFAGPTLTTALFAGLPAGVTMRPSPVVVLADPALGAASVPFEIVTSVGTPPRNLPNLHFDFARHQGRHGRVHPGHPNSDVRRTHRAKPSHAPLGRRGDGHRLHYTDPRVREQYLLRVLRVSPRDHDRRRANREPSLHSTCIRICGRAPDASRCPYRHARRHVDGIRSDDAFLSDVHHRAATDARGLLQPGGRRCRGRRAAGRNPDRPYAGRRLRGNSNTDMGRDPRGHRGHSRHAPLAVSSSRAVDSDQRAGERPHAGRTSPRVASGRQWRCDRCDRPARRNCCTAARRDDHRRATGDQRDSRR